MNSWMPVLLVLCCSFALQAVGSLHQARGCVIALRVLAARGVRILGRDVGSSQVLSGEGVEAGNVGMSH